MKKILNIIASMLMLITLGTACNSSTTSAPVRTSMVTVVQATFDPPYYLVFDDGKSAYVTNHSKWIPTFGEGQNELRYMITFYDLDTPAVGFDKQVEVLSVNPLTTRSMEQVSESDFEGDKGLQNYGAGVSIEDAYYTPYRSYLTVLARYSGGSAYTVHDIRLVKNDPTTSQFADLYVEDGYLWLELYHNDSNDKGTAQLGSYISYKMPQDLTQSYKGIKVISRNWNSGQPEVYKYDFKQEQAQ